MALSYIMSWCIHNIHVSEVSMPYIDAQMVNSKYDLDGLEEDLAAMDIHNHIDISVDAVGLLI